MPSSNDIWEVLSTARTIRRFTDEPVDDATLTRCLEAASWAPNGANAQAWRFVVVRSAEQRAAVAEAAPGPAVIEPVYGMSRPADDDRAGSPATTAPPTSSTTAPASAPRCCSAPTGTRPRPRSCSADRSTPPCRTSSSPPAPRARSCLTSWASYGGEQVLADASGSRPSGCSPATSSSAGLAEPRTTAPPPARRRRRPRPLGPTCGGAGGERTPGADFDVLRFRGKLPELRKVRGQGQQNGCPPDRTCAPAFCPTGHVGAT